MIKLLHLQNLKAWRDSGPVRLAPVTMLLGTNSSGKSTLLRALAGISLDIYAGERLSMRFIEIDKMSTGIGTSDDEARSYRYGYGVVDENLNWVKDPGEKKVYFEVSDYSTSYVFYENYRD